MGGQTIITSNFHVNVDELSPFPAQDKGRAIKPKGESEEADVCLYFKVNQPKVQQ